MVKQDALIVAIAVLRLAVRHVLALQQEVAALTVATHAHHPAVAVARQGVLQHAAAHVVVVARRVALLHVAVLVVVDAHQIALAIVAGHVLLVVAARVEVVVPQVAQARVEVDAHQVALVRVGAIVLELVVGQPNKVAILVQKLVSKTALMPVTRVVLVPVVTLVTWHVIVSVADYVMGPVHHHVKEVEAQLAVHVYSPVM